MGFRIRPQSAGAQGVTHRRIVWATIDDLRRFLPHAADSGRPLPIRAAADPPPCPSRVERIREALEAAKTFVDEHLGDPLDVERLSRQARLSRHHFSRTFREFEGTTPWAYVLERRIRHAAELLERDLPLSEVALRTGFCDQSHFSRVFKRLTGTTPGEFRRKRTNVQDGGAERR